MNYCYEYPRPCVTVDAVVFRENVTGWEVLLIRRKNPPHRGGWAFPGGFVEMDETLEEAVVRELEEETGLSGIELHQLRAFSAIHRDPRARVIGIAFYGFTTMENSRARGGDDAAEAQWFPVDDMPELVFDHGDIFATALKKLS